MALPFRLGAGGRLGSGQQWMSWLALEELVAMIQYALTADSLAGPTNAVAPHPVRNADFTKVLAQVLRRPAIFPAPAFALRLALGEMADALLLASQRVLPKKFESLGYRFAAGGPGIRSAGGFGGGFGRGAAEQPLSMLHYRASPALRA